MQEKIQKLKGEMLTDLKAATSDIAIKEVEIKYVGRNGLFNDVM